MPKHDAFNRSFNRLTSATLKAINELVVETAVKLGVEDGSKLRLDTTVVETDNAKLTNDRRPSNKASAFVPASRGASRC